MAKNTSDGSGKKPVASKSNKVHGQSNRFLRLFGLFTKREVPKGPKSR